MTTASVAEMRRLSTAELAHLYSAGHIDVDTLLAVDQADMRAARAQARADADRSAWYDAAHAQWQAAEEYCRGNLYSPLGLAELARAADRGAPSGDGMALWTCSDAWAERRASTELRNFWADNGGRLSYATYRRQQAMAARAYRDQRDLDRMAAAEVPEPREVRAPVAPRLATRPVPAPRPAGSIARYITAVNAATASTDLFSARIDALAARLASRAYGGGKR
jgi:hypothetical protein